jgi:hypothetical protein
VPLFVLGTTRRVEAPSLVLDRQGRSHENGILGFAYFIPCQSGPEYRAVSLLRKSTTGTYFRLIASRSMLKPILLRRQEQ